MPKHVLIETADNNDNNGKDYATDEWKLTDDEWNTFNREPCKKSYPCMQAGDCSTNHEDKCK